MFDGYIKAMFGCHAMHAPAQIMLQDMGKQHGKHVTAAVVIFATDQPMLSKEAQAIGPHELIIGDVLIRPHGKWASRNYIGYGLAGLAKSEAMFPEGHDIQTLDNGWKEAK